jgi:hypothetical protein
MRDIVNFILLLITWSFIIFIQSLKQHPKLAPRWFHLKRLLLYVWALTQIYFSLKPVSAFVIALYQPDLKELQRMSTLLDSLLIGAPPQQLLPAVVVSQGSKDEARMWVKAAEAQAQAGLWRTDPEGLTWLGGVCAGRFATPSIAELQATLPQGTGVPLRFSVLLGASPLTDIGALQAFDDGNTVFQLASQFNGLEAPSAQVVPVSAYLDDPTQGPRGAISAYPGALLRHYRAPEAQGKTFVQNGKQLNFLAPALGKLGTVHGGYLRSQDIPDPQSLAAHLATHWQQIQVGLHQEIEVCLGANWAGRVPMAHRITQVLTSTLAGASYSQADTTQLVWQEIQRYLLQAAYLGTLLGAVASGKPRVLLTLIGGGVFGNPHPLIWEVILWALDTVKPHLKAPLEVVLNAREIGVSRARLEQGVAVWDGKVIAV